MPGIGGRAATAQAPRASYPVNRADKTSFACGDKRCTAGKETCCMHPAAPTQGPPTFPYDSTCVEGKEAGPHVRDLTQVFELQCKYGGPGKLSIFSRCDESQDCGAQAMCCHRYTFAKESSAHRCLPFVGVGAGPCPGDELCVVGGEPCRTPSAECIVDEERGVPAASSARRTLTACARPQPTASPGSAASTPASAPLRASTAASSPTRSRARATPSARRIAPTSAGPVPGSVGAARKWPTRCAVARRGGARGARGIDLTVTSASRSTQRRRPVATAMVRDVTEGAPHG